MDKRGDISKHSKGKLASGLLRGAVVSGVVSAMAAASLGGVPKADATCIGVLRHQHQRWRGGHCSASLFGFALGLGPDTFATAGGFFNAAIAVGTNVTAEAGRLARGP